MVGRAVPSCIISRIPPTAISDRVCACASRTVRVEKGKVAIFWRQVHIPKFTAARAHITRKATLRCLGIQPGSAPYPSRDLTIPQRPAQEPAQGPAPGPAPGLAPEA